MESRLLFAGGPPSRLLAVANNKLANKCWPALTWRLTAPSAKKKKKRKEREGENRMAFRNHCFPVPATGFLPAIPQLVVFSVNRNLTGIFYHYDSSLCSLNRK